MKQSLQRTRKMMAEQLARVAQVSEVMGEQDALLRHTFDEHQVGLELGSLASPANAATCFLVPFDARGSVVCACCCLFLERKIDDGRRYCARGMFVRSFFIGQRLPDWPDAVRRPVSNQALLWHPQVVPMVVVNHSSSAPLEIKVSIGLYIPRACALADRPAGRKFFVYLSRPTGGNNQAPARFGIGLGCTYVPITDSGPLLCCLPPFVCNCASRRTL